MTSHFPLLLLPFLATCRVVHLMHLNDLLSLSYTSKKIQNLAKSMRKKSHKIVINVIGDSRIDLRNVNSREFYSRRVPLDQVQYSSIHIKTMKCENPKIVKKPNANIFEILCENRLDGLKMALNHVTVFFNSPIKGIIFSSDETNSKIMEWTIRRQQSIDNFFVERDMLSDESYTFILDTCPLIDRVFIHSKPTSVDFQHEQFQFQNNILHIEDGFWMSIDNLMNIDCRLCTICNSKLTNVEMNRFLKKWISGQVLKMIKCKVEMEVVIDLEVLFHGIDVEQFPDGVEKSYLTEEKDEIKINYGFDIKRNDGTVATIVHNGGNFQTNRFSMIVWL